MRIHWINLMRSSLLSSESSSSTTDGYWRYLYPPVAQSIVNKLCGSAALQEMKRVLDLIQDSRLLEAKKSYTKILENPIISSDDSSLIQSNSSLLTQLLTRHDEIQETFTLTSSKNPNWILATNMLGVSTHYMIDSDGYLMVRMESTQHNIPLMEQLAVVYEVSLFNKWIPFCTESSLISRLSLFSISSFS